MLRTYRAQCVKGLLRSKCMASKVGSLIKKKLGDFLPHHVAVMCSLRYALQ